MGLWLKQSTGVTVKIGPFVDESDGKTAETGLTLTQGDIRLSKNGGNMAQKNDANAATHDEIGYYDCALDSTDTNTLGRLQLMVHESGALPVYHEYMVVRADVYDTMCSTDYLQVDVIQLGSGTQSATDLKDFADAGYDPATNKVQGVVLCDTTTTNTDMVTTAGIADAVWDEVITQAAHNVANSAALYVRNLWRTLVTSIDQAQGGAAGSITLAAGESAVNDFFKGQTIAIFGGTGEGQARACYGYTGATKVALTRPDWATNPDATSEYAIINVGSAVVAAIEAASIDSIWDEVMDTNAPANCNSARETMNVIASAVAGKCSGVDTDTPTFRDLGDTKNRLVTAIDANDNRTASTQDGT